MSVHSVRVVEVSTGELMQAELHDEITVDDLMDVEDQWASARTDLRQRLRSAGVLRLQWPQSLHWDWSLKSVRVLLGGEMERFRFFGVRCGALWQGVMATQKSGWSARLPPDVGKGLIYADYVEVAPWNWTIVALYQKRKYAAIGPLLLRAAVEQSHAGGARRPCGAARAAPS